MKFGFCILRLCFLIFFIGLLLHSFGQSDDNNIFFSENNKVTDSLIARANNYLESDPDSAVYFGENAFNIADEKDYPALKYQASKIIADAWFYKDSLSKAIDYYKIAAQIIKETEGEESEEYASRLSDIGFCFYRLDAFDIAVNYYTEALNIFKASDNITEISNQLNNLGTIYFTTGQFSKAIDYFEQTLNYDRKLGDSTSLSTSYNNIGKVYEAWGYFDIAIEHYERSLEYLANSSDESKYAIRLSNIGTAYFDKKEYNKALSYLLKALAIDQRLNNHLKIAVRYNEIAAVYNATGDISKAINYNRQALDIFKSLDKKESQAIVLKDLGNNYLQLENYTMAEEYFEACIPIALLVGSKTNEMAAYHSLAQLYEKQFNYKKSYYFQQKYDTLKNAIFNAQKHRQLANYRIKYETEKKERENQLLKKDILIKQREQRILYIIVVSMIMLAILLFFLLRLKSKTLKQSRQLHQQEAKMAKMELEKKEIEKLHLQDKVFAEHQVNRLQREKYEAEIQLKNRELVSSTLQLVNKNEVLKEIKNKIRLNSSVIPENACQDLLRLINHNTDFDQNWKRFRTEFEKINPGFFDRIRHHYPDFSEQFIRLSAFLRIELSTKEIAQLMNVSVAAVNKNRQRLRKKLNLEAEADLSTFMKSI